MFSLKNFLCVSVAVVALGAPAMAMDDHGKPMEKVEKPVPKKAIAAADDHGKPEYEVTKHAVWGYTGTHGAYNWGMLDSKFQACLKGTKQSPINIATYEAQKMPPLKAAYAQSDLKVMNNGHSVQVNYDAGSSLESDGKAYALKQIHFHTPSEHYIDGAPYPMEAHFIHEAEDGAMAIVGVMLKVGEKNETIQKIWDHIPGIGETAIAKDLKISAANLLPRTGIYFQYEGSLTTPPCSENVKWHVMQDPIALSADQLRAFQAVYPVNARPIQPLNGRIVSGG